jgi:calcineurin-like phosphoesterase family protein
VWRQFTEFGLLLTHVPVHIDTITGGVDRHDQPKMLKNIHGHTHTNGEPRNNKIQDKKNYKCVCVELINYTPVHIDELRIK